MSDDLKERVLQALEYTRIPDGQLCLQCSNFQNWCSSVLAGEKPFDGQSRFCAWGSGVEHFNKDLRTPSEFVKAMHKR